MFVGWIAIFGAHLYLIEKLPGDDLAPMGTAIAPEEQTLYGDVGPEMCKTSSYPPLLPDERVPGFRKFPTERVYAFLPYFPEATYASLAAGSKAIDVLMPEWYRVVDAAEGAQELSRDVEHQVYLTRLIERDRPRMEVLPVVRIYQDALPAGAEGWAARSALARQLTDIAVREGYPGLALLASGTRDDEAPTVALFARMLDGMLNRQGLESALFVSVHDDVLAEPGLIEAMDQVFLKVFQEPWIGAPPAPLAAQDWFEQSVRDSLEELDREKTTIMLGTFAADWSRRTAAPETIPVAEAFRRLSLNGGALDFPAGAGNLRIRYTDPSGAPHEIWALDAASLYNQLASLGDMGFTSVGLWALGYEDPSAWSLFSARFMTPDSAATFLGKVDFGDFVGYGGEGPFQRVVAEARPGERFLLFDPETELIRDQGFSPLPEPWSLQRFGRAAPDEIVLTFDDGPDPEYTAQILDILKDRGAPATFFVVGNRVMREPDLVRRMVAEGHEIGSHTFSHPSIEHHPRTRIMLELGALQRLLVTITDRSTVLFRTPFGRSEGPMTGSDARPVSEIEEAGYVVVGSDIVPPDWLDLDAGQIVDYVMAELALHGGNVIVMHDAGGNRDATVAALGPLIDRLRADGYRIVGLHDMLGVSRDQLMPPPTNPRHLLDHVSFEVISGVSSIVVWVFGIVVAVGVLRGISILVLALGRRRHAAPQKASGTKSVTVVIPAYNEEPTILRCVDSVLASDYPDLEVIVVDDGSTDHTFDMVEARTLHEPRLRLIRGRHLGKWMALDIAYEHIRSEIVIGIDADSMLSWDAISRLAAHFDDPSVGAVAGRVRVGNQRNILTRLQALEYFTAQAIDRRAFERLNGILVVPGAIGAWRAEAVRAAHLYTPETVTEDADLTVSVLRAGYRVVYEENAVAFTEVPATVRLLMRQRLRWSFGMLQTAFKHLWGALRERRAVGFISIPDLLVIGYGFAILAPFADLVLLGTLFDLAVDRVFDMPAPPSDIRPMLLLAYLFLPAFDILLILFAMRFDRSESRWLILLVPIQRFFYRQLLYVSAWRAMFRAVTGRVTRWGQLKRVGDLRPQMVSKP